MIKTGLVSISFRDLSPKQIVDLVAKAQLDAIEWGGDVHVPHGNIQKAEEIRALTLNSGLKCSSYGSYYKLGASEKEGLSFDAVLDTAETLGVPTIRVWAGNKGSANADEAFWKIVMNDAVRVANLAEKRNISISLEYHGGSLTDTNESAQKLLQELNHKNIFTYWQPPNQMTFNERITGLKAILPFVSNIHVFHWERLPDGKMDRQPLEEGAQDWQEYLKVVSETDQDRYALMEFVRDGKVDQFKKDAEILKTWTQTL